MSGYPCCCRDDCTSCCTSGAWPETVYADLTALVAAARGIYGCDDTAVEQVFALTYAGNCVWIYSNPGNEWLTEVRFYLTKDSETGLCAGHVGIAFPCNYGSLGYIYSTAAFETLDCSSFSVTASYVLGPGSCFVGRCYINTTGGETITVSSS